MNKTMISRQVNIHVWVHENVKLTETRLPFEMAIIVVFIGIIMHQMTA